MVTHYGVLQQKQTKPMESAKEEAYGANARGNQMPASRVLLPMPRQMHLLLPASSSEHTYQISFKSGKPTRDSVSRAFIRGGHISSLYGGIYQHSRKTVDIQHTPYSL